MVLPHRPTDNLTGENIENHYQIQPTVMSGNIGRIGHPLLVCPGSSKILCQ